MTFNIDISEADITAYERDGAVCLRGLFDADWIARLRTATERVMANPGPMGMRYGKREDAGTFFGDMYVWTFDADFEAFAAHPRRQGRHAGHAAGRQDQEIASRLFTFLGGCTGPGTGCRFNHCLHPKPTAHTHRLRAQNAGNTHFSPRRR